MFTRDDYPFFPMNEIIEVSRRRRRRRRFPALPFSLLHLGSLGRSRRSFREIVLSKALLGTKTWKSGELPDKGRKFVSVAYLQVPRRLRLRGKTPASTTPRKGALALAQGALLHCD